MLYKTLIVLLSLSFAVLPVLFNQHSGDPQPMHTRAQIVQQKYCRADADLFTVSLRLKIEVSNPSASPIQVRTPLIPYVAKVSSNIADAESGRFLYQLTRSHYPQNARPSRTARIAAGKTLTLHTGYDFVARYRPAFSYPQSLSTGTFAVILVLRPEIESNEEKAADVIDSLTTEPFIVQVDDNPKVVSCE